MHVTPKDFIKRKRKGRQGRFRRDWRKERAVTGGGLARHVLTGGKSAEVTAVTAPSLPGERKVTKQEVSQVVKD
jgi:hypothetical protein